MKPRALCLFGPTAVGKTRLLLHAFPRQAEVISADSMQVYRGMDVGTAKPDHATRSRLPHHLLDVRKPSEQFDVGEFVRSAESLIPEIHGRGKLPVVAGGTAFYFRALLFGLPETPPPDPKLRQRLQHRMEIEGPDKLHGELSEVDPESARAIAPADRYRILRALEVYHSTGRPRSTYSVPAEPRDDWRAALVGLYREREELYRRIDCRVSQMMDSGLIEEVKRLAAAGFGPEAPGMRGIGYREILRRAAEKSGHGAVPSSGAGEPDAEPSRAVVDEGAFDFSPAERRVLTQEIRKNSRRYAKRQLTFFRSLPGVHWIDAAAPDAAGRVAALAGEL